MRAYTNLLSGQYWTPECPCREGYHVWLTAGSSSTQPIAEGTPCACGAMLWREALRQKPDDWLADIERRLAEIERRLNDR